MQIMFKNDTKRGENMNKVSIYDKKNLETLGERIKSERTKRNWTQEEFAKKINVPRQKVIKIERGDCYPDSEDLKNIGNELQISVDYLLGRIASKNTNYLEISQLTGLSDKAIEKLSKFSKKDSWQLDILYGDEGNYIDFSRIINAIIEDENFEKWIFFIRAEINSSKIDELEKIISANKYEYEIDDENYDIDYDCKKEEIYEFKVGQMNNKIINNLKVRLTDSFSNRWELNKEQTKILKKCYDNSENINLLKLRGGIKGNVNKRNNKKQKI